eukprot:gene7547-7757_t
MTGFKNQGNTTMCASYAAMAVAEGVAKISGMPSTSYSEKGLHFCDSSRSPTARRPKTEGWFVEEAMRLINVTGTALGSCMPNDRVPVMYNINNIGNLGGNCSRQLFQNTTCYNRRFRLRILTPKTPADYPPIMEHIFKHGSVVTRFMMREGMLQDLKKMKASFRTGEFANLPVVLPSGNLTVNYIHAVALVGWDFRSTSNNRRFWVVKDSDGQYPSMWKHPIVYVYAYCAASSRTIQVEWVGDLPAAMTEDNLCRSDVKMTRIDMSRDSSNGAFVARLSCEANSRFGTFESED